MNDTFNQGSQLNLAIRSTLRSNKVNIAEDGHARISI